MLQFKVYFSKKDKSYFARYKSGKTWKSKFVPVSVDNQIDAEQWFQEWHKTTVTLGFPAANDAVLKPVVTMEAYYDRWLDYKTNRYLTKKKKKLDEKTLKGFVSSMKNWVLVHKIATIDLEKLTHKDAIEFINSLKGAPSSRRTVIQAATAFVSDARKLGWITTAANVFKDEIVQEHIPVQETLAGYRTVIHLTKAEVDKFLTYNGEGVYFWRKVRHVFALTTGCREEEMQGLQIGDIDFDLGTVMIDRQLKKLIGEVRGKKKPVFKAPKQDSNRVLPLQKQCQEVLKWWVTKGWRFMVGRDPQKTDAVFPNLHGHFCMSLAACNLRDELEAAGVGNKFEGKWNITNHATRRTYATMLDAAGVQESLIKALLGHKAVGVTDKHYIARHVERFRAAVNSITFPGMTVEKLFKRTGAVGT